MPSHKRNRRSRRSRRTHGGASTGEWGAAAYGAAGSQTAVPGTGNLLAVNNLSGVSMCKGGGLGDNAPDPIVVGAKPPTAAPLATGGRRRRKNGGKGILTDVAVPAVLLYANQAFKGRRSSSKKRHGRRHSSRRTHRRRR